MTQVEIFTDGACKGNPGPGGWGAILRTGDHEKELSGSERATTNNRMELTGAIRGLTALKGPCEVTLHTDSRYVIDGITKWVFGWQKTGWINSARKPVANTDLWHELIAAVRRTRCAGSGSRVMPAIRRTSAQMRWRAKRHAPPDDRARRSVV